MSIEVGENTLAVWVINFQDGNMIAALNEKEDTLCLEFRFRDYVDNETWGSKDRKRFYRKEVPNSPENIELLFGIMRTTKVFLKAAEFCELLREGKTFKEFTELFFMMPGMHFSHQSSEEKLNG
jgi:hypothetical protein